MSVTAKDLMITPHAVLQPHFSLPKAFRLFQEASEVEGEVYGMIVVDESEMLVGVLSMYDVFLHFLPRSVQIWVAMEDINFLALMERLYDKAKGVRVEDLMTRDPVSITPGTPLLAVLDVLIRKHIRRIPVVEDEKVVGLVYASNVFYHLVNQVSDRGVRDNAGLQG